VIHVCVQEVLLKFLNVDIGNIVEVALNLFDLGGSSTVRNGLDFEFVAITSSLGLGHALIHTGFLKTT